MNETAAHLVDYVIGDVPLRHWVLTVPPPLRYLLAYDTSLCTAVLGFFVRAVFRWLRHKAKAELGLSSVSQAHPGAVSVLHRASSHLALNIHAHSLVADGVFVQESESEELTFRALPAPRRGEVTQVAWETCCKTVKLLQKRGQWLEMDPSEDRFAQEEPALAECCAASLTGVLTLGPKAGQRLIRVRGAAAGTEEPPNTQEQTPGYGFFVHAKTRVSAGDKKGRERLARYATRPVFAERRLCLLADGRVRLELKRVWRDGTHSIIFDPLDFLAKLAALVVPPRSHRVRYHGAWGRRFKLRSQVLPEKEPDEACEHTHEKQNERSEKRRYYDWARLLARVFKVDVLACPKCQAGRMQRIAWITIPSVIRAILESVGLPADSPRLAPSRLPQQEELFDSP